MKKILLVWWVFASGFMGFSQTQVTDFSSVQAVSPLNSQLIDTLNNQLLFMAYKPELKKQTTIWTTDGTKENTYQLFDKNEDYPNYAYSSNNERLGKYLYIRQQDGIWKTDGHSLQKVVEYSDSLNTLLKIGDKLLIYFEKNNWQTSEKTTSFGWLDSSDKISLWFQDIHGYKVVNNELHFLKFNSSNLKWELYRYLDNKLELITSFSHINKNIDRFEFSIYNNIDYYFLGINQEIKLIASNRKTKEVTIKNWSDRVYSHGSFIQDENNNPYFFRSNIDSIAVYSLAEKSFLNEVFVVSSKDIFKDPTTPPGYMGYRLFRNKLSYWSSHGGYSITYFAINEYDFKTKKYRISKNLKERLGFMSYSPLPVLKPLSEDEYEINNGLGKIFKYSFEKDSVSLLSTYSYPIRKPDTSFVLNNTKLILRGNLYKIIEKDTISMIPQKRIYSPSGANFLSRQLKDKLLFWNYNNETKKTELWVSNGEKGGSLLLKIFNEYFPSNLDVYQNQVKVVDNRAYFHTTDYKSLFLYTTDGTVDGTKQIWQSDGSVFTDPGNVVTNEHQVVYRILSNSGYRKIIVIENGIANEIKNIPTLKYGSDVVLTQANVYVISSGEKNGWSYEELYKLEGTNLRLIDNETNGYKVYRDRLYYSKISYGKGTGFAGLYYYDEAKNQVSVVTKNNIDEYDIYGNKLISMTRIQQNNENVLSYTVRDLPTDKIDLTMTYNYPNNDLTSFNIQNFDGNSLIFSNYRKIIFIKNNEKREYDLKYKLYEPPRKYGNGILVQEVLESNIYNPIKLTYYDFSNNTFITILDNTPHQQIYHNPDANFILIPFAKSSTERIWKQWNHYTKILQDLDGGFYQINCSSAFGIEQSGPQMIYNYWNFDGKNLNKTYQINGYIWSYLKRQDSYFSINAPNIIALGKDSTISIARMVNQNEMFMLHDIFQYNKQLYAYTFTYNEGYQVWKLPQLTNDKLNQLSQNCSLLFNLADALSTEDNNVEINIFPNPASQNLYVGIEETTDYQIIDLKGTIIMKGKVNSTEPINISTLQPNIYFIRLRHHNLPITKRFMKF